ncbi:Type 1 glutamine amidotransferase-like domain-containing protein, partial [Chloroflexota bacterium]
MKKLVLYSDQIKHLSKKIDSALIKLLDKSKPKIGYIPSSADPKRKHYAARQEYYSRIDMELEIYFELDEDYYPDKLDTLLSCDAIHLSGGNTYYFLHWLRKRGLMDTLTQYVSQGGVLIGVSAGSILMTPDISTSSISDDKQMEGESGYKGLNLVDFSF